MEFGKNGICDSRRVRRILLCHPLDFSKKINSTLEDRAILNEASA